MSDDLVAFLRARLDEHKQAADDGELAGLDRGWPFSVDAQAEWEYRAATAYRERFKPTRVLYDIEAKRRIIDAFLRREHDSNGLPTVGTADSRAAGLLMAIRLLALPYADHPDYRPDWRL